MNAKVGQYFYTPHGNAFRIYRYDRVTAGATSASPVNEQPFFYDREEARKRVYELNGWKYKSK